MIFKKAKWRWIFGGFSDVGFNGGMEIPAPNIDRIGELIEPAFIGLNPDTWKQEDGL